MSRAQFSLWEELIVDSFAGGGGTSTGIELATGRIVNIAINHDADAILMDRAARLDFLHEQLPEFEELFPLLSDFRFSGYRILGDLICDVDDENRATERKHLHRPKDSPAFSEMMQAYIDKPQSQNYREAVSKVCRKRLDAIVKPHFAVFYVVALGKRNLLWDLLPDAIEENVKRYRG